MSCRNNLGSRSIKLLRRVDDALRFRVYWAEWRSVCGMRYWNIQSGHRKCHLYGLSSQFQLAKCQCSTYRLHLHHRVYRTGWRPVLGGIWLRGRSDLLRWLYVHDVKRHKFWFSHNGV